MDLNGQLQDLSVPLGELLCVSVASRPDAVMEVNHAAAETAFLQQFELQADMVGEGLFAAFYPCWVLPQQVGNPELTADRAGRSERNLPVPWNGDRPLRGRATPDIVA